jgi:two-component system KDP operon response regulator KdpE
MDDRTRILLVEDDANIIDLVRANLVVREFAVTVARNGRDALAAFEREEPELVLVDLMLPASIDGFEICRKLRQLGSVGIIVLSARVDETDKVRALNLGADDYLTKPFGIDELLARIHATLRRTRVAPPDAGDARQPVAVGDVVIDAARRTVTRGGALVKLSPTEFALLRELSERPGELVTHATLLRKVWGPGYDTNTEYTRVYVGRLRAKLEDGGGDPVIITEPRVGYRLATREISEFRSVSER